MEQPAVDRVYKQFQAGDATPTSQATLHMAVAMLADDPASAITFVQRDWLRRRCAQKRDASRNPLPWVPFSAHQCRKLVPLLLAWSAGKVWQAALIDGLRGVVPEELLPEVQKAC